MLYVDIPFPDRIAFGAKSQAQWSTDVAAVLSGHESTNQNWTQSRHVYDVSLAVRLQSDYVLVRDHFHAMRGRAKSFPFKDYLDFEVSSTQGVPSTAGATWSMRKRYGTGAYVWDRIITRPVLGTILVYRTRSAVVTNATPNATINYATGGVVMASHVSGDAYTWAGQFFVPCRYDTDILPGAIVNKHPSGELIVQCDSIPVLEVRE